MGDGGQPTLSEVITTHMESAMENIHTAIPGRVVSYDGHAKRTATIKPSIRLPTSTGVCLDIPPIPGVPVIFPSCASGSMVFNLQPGDGVLLITSEVGIGKFLASKDADTVDPDDSSRFTLTDVVAIPGLRSEPSMPKAPGVDAGLVLYTPDGAAVSLGKTILVRSDASDLRSELEKMYEDIKQLRTDLELNFSALSTAIAGDATFLAGTVTAAAAAASVHQLAIAKILTDKEALQELLS